MFKTNVQKFVCLRRVNPRIDPHFLRRLPEFFPSPDYFLQLDPSYEPERGPPELPAGDIPPPDAVNTVTFSILQNLVRVGLVQPDGQPHMWHAAMYNGGAKLTRLGEHYRQLVLDGHL